MNKNKTGSVDDALPLIIAIVLVSILIAIIYVNKSKNINGPQKKENDLIGRVVKFDGCEYIKTATGDYPYYVLTHKGNCSNPIHPYNTERIEK